MNRQGARQAAGEIGVGFKEVRITMLVWARRSPWFQVGTMDWLLVGCSPGAGTASYSREVYPRWEVWPIVFATGCVDASPTIGPFARQHPRASLDLKTSGRDRLPLQESA